MNGQEALLLTTAHCQYPVRGRSRYSFFPVIVIAVLNAFLLFPGRDPGPKKSTVRKQSPEFCPGIGVFVYQFGNYIAGASQERLPR